MIATAEKMSGILDDPRGYVHPCADGTSLLCTDLVSEELAAVSFLRFSSEKLLPRIFNEGDGTLGWFLTQFLAPGVRVLSFLRETEDKQLIPLGLGWINNSVTVGNPAVFTKAEVGEAFFRKVSPRDTIWCGRMAIHYTFDRLGLDVIHGMTAEPNIPAVRYARTLGFNVSGPIPCSTTWMDEAGERKPCGSFISAYTKQMWEERSWK